MMKNGNQNNIFLAWMGFYLPPFILAYEIIYHLASDTPLWPPPLLTVLPVGFFAFYQLIPILAGQALICEYVSSLKARICFSVLLCFIITFAWAYWGWNYNTDPDIVIKGETNAIIGSSIITLPITIFFLFFTHRRNETFIG